MSTLSHMTPMTDSGGNVPGEVFGDVRQLPWVPVLDHGTRTRLSLREVLVRAHDLNNWGSTSPVELMVLSRTVSAFAALVVREMGGRVDQDDPRLDPVAVDAVLDRHADVLHLKHPSTPFAQEWDVPAPAKPKDPLRYLRFEQPGASAKSWRTRGVAPQPYLDEVDLGWVVLHLLCHWYAGFGATAAKSPTGHNFANVAMGFRRGADMQMFWRGPNLAATILANTPSSWVVGDGLPAFLDRRGATRGTGPVLHPLWATSYAPNSVLLSWGEGEMPTGITVGGSQWGLYGKRPSGDAKTKASEEAFKRTVYDNRHLDPARAWVAISPKPATGDTHRVLAPIQPDRAPLVRLREWAQSIGSDFAEKLPDRVDAVVRAHQIDATWALEFFTARQAGEATAPVMEDAAWLSYEPSTLLLDLDGAEALRASTTLATTMADAGKSAVRRLVDRDTGGGGDRKRASTFAQAVTTSFDVQFGVECEAVVDRVVSLARVGQEADEPLRKTLADAVMRAFDVVIAPYAQTLGIPQVAQSRGALARKVYGLAQPTARPDGAVPSPEPEAGQETAA
jgi:hypothetical protein